MKAEINVTPLIDVLLVILIIFMLVAPVAPRALNAAVPDLASGRRSPDPTSLVLEVGPEDYALNASPVLTLADLDRRLRAIFDARRDRTLFIKAGARVSYERVVAAVDMASGAGATHIGLVDGPEDEHH
jgi:biopolymer transport protein TolR